MKNIVNFIFEKLKLNKDSKIITTSFKKEISNKAQWILSVCNIAQSFEVYNEFKTAISNWIEEFNLIDNNHTNESNNLKGPFVINFKYAINTSFERIYKRGRKLYINKIKKQANISLGNDYIQLYIGDNAILIESTPKNNIYFATYFYRNSFLSS